MEEVTAGVCLVSTNRSRYSAVYSWGPCENGFPHAAISAAAHQRQRRHGLKKKSTTFLRLRRILENTVRLSKSWIVYNTCIPTFRNRGTAYNSRSFAGNLLFVGDYGSWCSSTTNFTVSSIMLMWNLVNFWFPWQLLRFLRFSIVIPS